MEAIFYLPIGIMLGIACAYVSIYVTRVDTLRSYLQEVENNDKAIKEGKK
jgi:hypothetical protein